MTTVLCGVKRGDGVPCEAEKGHYGGHEWPPTAAECVLRVGDTMRIMPWVVSPMDDAAFLARVVEIRTEPDGTKYLLLQRAL